MNPMTMEVMIPTAAAHESPADGAADRRNDEEYEQRRQLT